MPERPLLLLVDLAALAFRSHYALIKRPLVRTDGMMTSALFGMANTLLTVLEERKPDYVLCALDRAADNFRHKIYPEYKAHRPPCPEELKAQLEMQEEFCESFGLAWDANENFEADDLIGTYTTKAKAENMDVLIFSGDKDFMQLLDENTKMLITHRGGEQEIFTHDKVEGKLGVFPNQVIDYLSLLGDAADNVPGAPGVGKVTATQLLKEYGTLEGVLEAAPNIKKKGLAAKLMDNREQIEMSKRLVIIDCDVQSVKDFPHLAFSGIPLNKAKPFLEEMEFPRILSRLQKIDHVTEVVPQAELGKVDYQWSEDWAAFSDAIKSMDSEHWTMSYEGGVDSLESIALSPSVGVVRALRNVLPMHEESLIELLSGLKISAFGLKPYLRSGIRFSKKLEIEYDLELQQSVIKPGKTMTLRELIDDNGTYQCIKLGKEGNRKRTFVDLNDEEALIYLSEQSDLARAVAELQAEKMAELGLCEVYESLEMPLLKVIANMEHLGVKLDVNKVNQQELEVGEELNNLTSKIYELAGEEFNINSTKQLGVILFEKLKVQDELGLKKVKTTKTGYSTDSGVLESIKEHPMGESLLRYRFLSKLRSTYLEALPKQVNGSTGRIHTSYHQNGTATGRISSQNPNLQNIPMRMPEGARIREAFIPSTEDKVMISADYSQIELRVLAFFSKDEKMKEAFLSDHDIHTATAATVFGIAPEWVTSQQRSGAKAINFGLLYGMGPRNLASQTGLVFAEAQKFIRSYFESFPSIQGYMEKQVQDARTHGFVTTLAGRRRYLPDLNASNGMLRNAAENMALNTPIQGSAADIIKWTMLRLAKRIEEESLPINLLLQVHDELVFEVSRDRADEMMQVIKQEMESLVDLPEDFDIPLTVEIKQGQNWLESH